MTDKWFRYYRHGSTVQLPFQLADDLIGTPHGQYAELYMTDQDPRDLLASFKDVLDEMYSTVKAKNNDYATGEDPFQNFRRSAIVAGIAPERGFLVRMADKMARVENLLDKPPAVVGESVHDTLLDLANYAILLSLFIEGKRDDRNMGRTNGD